MRWWLLYFSWILAFSGLLLSLYFGEILRYEPCRLCWYQRVSLFPLALILGIAAFRGDERIGIYALPLALFGLFAALYQGLEPYLSFLQKEAPCTSHQCLDPVFTLFDFLSFPLLSAIGFFSIAILLFLLLRIQK